MDITGYAYIIINLDNKRIVTIPFAIAKILTDLKIAAKIVSPCQIMFRGSIDLEVSVFSQPDEFVCRFLWSVHNGNIAA